MNAKETALKLIANNRSVIPIKPKSKEPYIAWKEFQTRIATADELKQWFKDYPDAGIAVITGEISGIVVFDVDPRNDGSNKQFLPYKTVSSKTGGNGRHYFFKYPSTVKVDCHPSIMQGIDLKANSGYVLISPSLHPSGNKYEWIKSILDHEPNYLPQELLDLIRKIGKKQSNFDPSLLSGVDEGSRNNSAASVIGKLLKRFPEEEWESEAWHHLLNWNSQNKSPLPEDELRATFESIKKKQLSSNEEGRDKNTPVALQLVEEIKKEKIVFFHTPHKEGFAAIKGDGQQVLKLRSRAFKQYIAHHIYKNYGRIISADTINNIIQLLEGKAVFDGKEYELYVRIAQYGDAIWYDIGNGSVVHIDKSGWRTSSTPPILFKRFPHQRVQVIPIPGGNIDDLCNFVNLQNEDEKLLFIVYTVACFIPNFPHPLLVFYGPQGAGKTTPLRLIKSLVDPSVLKTLTAPDTLREFVQLASHHHFLFLDNLSSIRDWLSDALARACTGDGFTKRELFSDDDDVIYSFQRTIGLNGINLVVQKADLLDRSMLIGLERIPKEKRREEQEFWKEFKKLKPGILGAIFDCVVLALIEYPDISLPSHPRMADFARWGCAIARALGHEDQDFLDAYYRNINSQNDAAIEASPVGIALLDFMDDLDEWEGTASDLLGELEEKAEKLKINTKAREWPKDPSWLTRRIQLIHSNLADQGIIVVRDDKSRPRRILLRKSRENPVAADNADVATRTEATLPTPFLSSLDINVSKNGTETPQSNNKSKPTQSQQEMSIDSIPGLEGYES